MSDLTHMIDIAPPAWATEHKAYDGYVKHSTESMHKPVCDEGHDPVPVRMDINDWLNLDDHGRAFIERDSQPWIVIGTECAYKWTPAEARVLAAALLELADDAEREPTA